jgi:hypothetical protein
MKGFPECGKHPPETLMGINGEGSIQAVFGGNLGIQVLAHKMRWNKAMVAGGFRGSSQT